MSKYAIPTLTSDQLELAASAELGAETRAFYSFTPTRRLGVLEMAGAGDGATAANATLTTESSYVPDASLLVGEDLVLFTESPVKSAVNVVVVLNAVFNSVAITSNSINAGASVVTTATPHGATTGDTVVISGVTGSTPTINGSRVVTVLSPTTFSVPVITTAGGTGGAAARTGTVTATLTAPLQSQDQGAYLPQGIACDFTASNPTAQIRGITSVASVTGCSAGTKFTVQSLPAAASFIEIAGVTTKSYDPPSPKSVSIPDGYDSARWVKRGREVEHKLELKSVNQGGAEGLSRINGHAVTIKLERRAEGAILTQREVFGNYRPQNSVTKGDGETPSEVSVTGMYADYGCFC